MKISVIGLGYLGAVTAASLASLGHKVVGFDHDASKINDYNNNHIQFHEPGLQNLINENMQGNKLSFMSTKHFDGYLGDVAVIGVGTPSTTDGNYDMRQVNNAMDWVLGRTENLQAIVMKSTVPPGTGTKFTKSLIPMNHISYYSCPEFLREGNALNDFLHPDRIIIGNNSKEEGELIRNLYRGIDAPYVFTDTTTAEMIKCSANVFLSTKISFINSVANLCGAVGANIDDVQKGLGLDPRIGQYYLNPGVGYGGSCLPKDTLSFARIMENNNIENDLIASVIKINELQKQQPFQYLRSRIKCIEDLKVGVLGLSFKPNTDDVRESPAIPLVKQLVRAGASVTAYDPFANAKAKNALLGSPVPHFAKSIEECTHGTNVVFVMHTWEEMESVDWANMSSRMRSPKIIYDSRNSLDPNLMRRHNFEYVPIGKR
tara:strand:+ start:1002 stop:2294 length:1293 start_codon:yes stop_codon:yes gene_type:complete